MSFWVSKSAEPVWPPTESFQKEVSAMTLWSMLKRILGIEATDESEDPSWHMDYP